MKTPQDIGKSHGLTPAQAEMFAQFYRADNHGWGPIHPDVQAAYNRGLSDSEFAIWLVGYVQDKWPAPDELTDALFTERQRAARAEYERDALRDAVERLLPIVEQVTGRVLGAEIVLHAARHVLDGKGTMGDWLKDSNIHVG